MKGILKDLDSVFQLISSIPVSRDSVDVMYAAKTKLRKVYAELEKLDTQTEITDFE